MLCIRYYIKFILLDIIQNIICIRYFTRYICIPQNIFCKKLYKKCHVQKVNIMSKKWISCPKKIIYTVLQNYFFLIFDYITFIFRFPNLKVKNKTSILTISEELIPKRI